MQEVGMEEVEVYITRRQNMVVQYIAMPPIIALCREADWQPGSWILKRWWER